MPKTRQRREAPEVGAWTQDVEQAGRTGVGCRRHQLSQGLDPGLRPGDDEPQTTLGAATGFPGIGAASPEGEP